jgi:hypothetical protein
MSEQSGGIKKDKALTGKSSAFDLIMPCLEEGEIKKWQT